MNTKNPQLSALEISYLAKEMQILIDSKVDKIFQPETRHIILQLHKTGTGKNLLRLKVPDYFCITQTKQTTKQPSQFCMYLRKKLGNTFLIGIEQLGFERILKLRFRTKEKELSLILEFFSPGNIILTEDNKILSAIEYQEYKDRKIRPKEEYRHPQKEHNLFELNEEKLSDMLKKTDKESLVKALAIELGLGGMFAEEACAQAGADKDKKPAETKKTEELYKALKELTEKQITPAKMGDEILPFEITSKKCQKLDKKTFSEAIDSETRQETSDESKETDTKYKEKTKKLETMIKSQEESIKNLTKKEQEARQTGDLIYSNFQQIETILKEAKTKETQEKMKKEEKIKQYNPKEKTITVELK